LNFDNGDIRIRLGPLSEQINVTPQLTSAISDSTGTTVEGSLQNKANTTYLLEFFVDDDCDQDGIAFLGSGNVTTDGNGSATFTFVAASSGASGTFGGLSSVTVTTDASWVATAPTFTANTIAGSYTITASVAGVATPADFLLTNTPAAVGQQCAGHAFDFHT